MQYDVEFLDTAGEVVTVAAADGPEFIFNHSHLESGHSYLFRVRARVEESVGPYSRTGPVLFDPTSPVLSGASPAGPGSEQPSARQPRLEQPSDLPAPTEVAMAQWPDGPLQVSWVSDAAYRGHHEVLARDVTTGHVWVFIAEQPKNDSRRHYLEWRPEEFQSGTEYAFTVRATADGKEGRESGSVTMVFDPQTPDGMYQLGQYFDEHDDEGLAAVWFRAAAEAGHAEAAIEMAHSSINRNRDDGAATSWLERAVDLGSVRAMISLGDQAMREAFLCITVDEYDDLRAMEPDADFPPPDTEAARYWYTRAADAGDSAAMEKLGCLELEAGNLDQARRWLESCDGQGSRALLGLAECAARQGRLDDARQYYWSCWTVNVYSRHFASEGLGDLAAGLSDTAEAVRLYEQALGECSADWYLGRIQAKIDAAKSRTGGRRAPLLELPNSTDEG